MLRLKAIVAYVLTYGGYALMWVLFAFYLLAGWAGLTGTSSANDAPPLAWPWTWVIGAIGLGIFAFAVKGFIEWSRTWRQRLREMWLEGENPSWIEVHRQKRLDGE